MKERKERKKRSDYVEVKWRDSRIPWVPWVLDVVGRRDVDVQRGWTARQDEPLHDCFE